MPRQGEDQAARALSSVDPSWGLEQTERALGVMHQKRRRRRATRALVAVAGVAAIVIAGIVVSTRAPAPRVGEAPGIDAPDADSSVVTLADGSTVTPLGAAQVEVREVSDERIRIAVRDGDVEVDVVPRPAREFVVEAGPLHIVVLGTHFTVEEVDGEETEGVERAVVEGDEGEGARRVSVQRGHVRARWRDEAPRDLLAGQSAIFGDAIASPEGSAPAAVPEASPEESPRVRTPAPTSRPRETTAAAEDWRAAAERGAYDEAYASMRAQGATAVRDDVEDLLLAADAARLSGHPEDALSFLDRAVDEHPSDARSAMAAFTRGRVLSGLGRTDDAARSFERSLALGAEGSLRENALARAVEAHGRAGHGAEAARLARDYVAEYPSGRWLASVRAYGGLEE